MFEIQGNNNLSEESFNIVDHAAESVSNQFSKTIAFNTSVLNGMSHEIRTHMNAIVAFSFLLKDGKFKESEKNDFVNQIYFTCEKLISLFENFLETALVDTGSSNNDEVSCNSNNMLDLLFTEFREIIRKSSKEGLELITEIQRSSSDEIFIDKTKIFRILRCLFHNSLQHTNSGYIKIGYYNSINELTFYVLDSGQGFSCTREFLHTNDLSGSLEKFQDLTSAVNITLARKLIQFLDGSFNIRENGVSGSGIYFSIPIKVNSKENLPINKFVNNMI